MQRSELEVAVCGDEGACVSVEVLARLARDSLRVLEGVCHSDGSTVEMGSRCSRCLRVLLNGMVLGVILGCGSVTERVTVAEVCFVSIDGARGGSDGAIQLPVTIMESDVTVTA